MHVCVCVCVCVYTHALDTHDREEGMDADKQYIIRRAISLALKVHVSKVVIEQISAVRLGALMIYIYIYIYIHDIIYVLSLSLSLSLSLCLCLFVYVCVCVCIIHIYFGISTHGGSGILSCPKPSTPACADSAHGQMHQLE